MLVRGVSHLRVQQVGASEGGRGRWSSRRWGRRGGDNWVDTLAERKEGTALEDSEGEYLTKLFFLVLASSAAVKW